MNVTFRFDTGKRRWSAAEVEAFRTAFDAVSQEEEPLLGFEHDGASLLAEGRVPEALEAYRRMVALHPKEALHRGQLAMALLEAGAGEEARTEARRGTEVEPILGAGLAHAGVGAAARHAGAPLQAGLRLRGGGGGLPEGPDAGSDGLRDARRPGHPLGVRPAGRALRARTRGWRRRWHEYLELREDLNRKDMDDHLLLDLFLLERYAELLKLANGMEPSALRNSVRLSASALVDGAAVAVKNAAKWVPSMEARREALEDAANRLMRLRRYPEAHALLTEAARGAPDAVEKQRRLTAAGEGGALRAEVAEGRTIRARWCSGSSWRCWTTMAAGRRWRGCCTSLADGGAGAGGRGGADACADAAEPRGAGGGAADAARWTWRSR